MGRCSCRQRGGVVVAEQAPPGSGKTHLLAQAVTHARRKRKMRIAIAAQTNAQADDICNRLARAPWNLPNVRFVKRGAQPDGLDDSVTVIERAGDLPTGPCAVVATTAKWGLVDLPLAFDVLFVDEAWQMPWARFMLLHQVAGRFVLIGDPGQIPPVVTIDSSRWETAPLAPHLPAPELLLRHQKFGAIALALPASRRLPADAVELLQPFYSFRFDGWAGRDERAVVAGGRRRDRIDDAIDLLRDGSVAVATVPTPEDGPLFDVDEEVAARAVDIVVRLLDRKSEVLLADSGDAAKRRIPLEPSNIGLAATHRSMNAALEAKLPARLRRSVHVDTPERWQGLERHVMVMVHPLSDVARPSSFDLETGRLCVMASRHKAGLVVVSRDHVGETLEGLITTADQAIGRPDVNGQGHDRHLSFWTALARGGRIARLV